VKKYRLVLEAYEQVGDVPGDEAVEIQATWPLGRGAWKANKELLESIKEEVSK